MIVCCIMITRFCWSLVLIMLLVPYVVVGWLCFSLVVLHPDCNQIEGRCLFVGVGCFLVILQYKRKAKKKRFRECFSCLVGNYKGKKKKNRLTNQNRTKEKTAAIMLQPLYKC